MKHLLLTLLCVFSFSVIVAQTNIKGTIKDKFTNEW